MPDLIYESALAGVTTPSGLAVSLREISERGMIDLRGLASSRKFMAAAKAMLGVDLPRQPRSSVSWGDVKILWLAPDQWLILCPRMKVVTLLAELRGAFAGIHSLAADVSDMRAIIRIEGEGSREILMKGCALDLLSSDYPAGTVRRMGFAGIAALLHVVEDDIFDIYVFRSYAHYAWDFLMATAREPAAIRLFGKQKLPI